MTQREALLQWAENEYGTQAEYLWEGDTDSAVLRRRDTRKWYAICMRVPGVKLGFDTEAPVEVVNLKLDPLLIGALRNLPGYRPAWHMNKNYWLTVLLDGTLPFEDIAELTAQSYALTGGKRKKPRASAK